jgi:hypothetical protein
MMLEHKHLLSEEHGDEIDSESQKGRSSADGTVVIARKGWLPAVLVVYSLLVTALSIIPHLNPSSRLSRPYCEQANMYTMVLPSNC